MRRKGFTMLELFVVIGIIVLIAAILLPTLGRTIREAQRASQAAAMHAIETALEAYKDAFGDYPRFDPHATNTATSGASLLCWALMAPGPETQDGYGDPNDTNHDGSIMGVGFRTRGNQGKVYSFLQPDQFKIGRPAGITKYDD